MRWKKNEQYNRKTSLILGGGGVPLPHTDHQETTSETRAVAQKVIKETLKVNMKGAILACHRLKNKKRVLIKFQDMEDRDAVYQARFDQTQDPNSKVIIHENLTETRANMIRVLGQMREKDQITNYHTKNGMIYARNSRDKKYALIEPWLSEQEILNAVNSAQNKTSTGAGSFLTLLPGGEFRNPLKTRPKTSRNLCYSDDSENYFQKPLFFPES